MRRTLTALLFALSLFLGTAHGEASDTGDVAYRTTRYFRFFGADDVHSTLDKLAANADLRLEILCAKIGACGRLTRPIDVWAAADPETFAAQFGGQNPMSEWAAGVTFLDEQRIVLRRHGSAVFTLDETFDHEVAHVLAHTFDDGSGRIRAMPRWFQEGLAIWMAGENTTNRLIEAQHAAATGSLVSFEELDERFPNEGSAVGVAYAQSALFVQRLARTHGPVAIAGLLHDVGDGQRFDDAFIAHLGGSPAVLFQTATDDLEKTSSIFTLFTDGNLIWTLVTLLFIAVAWWQIRDRKAQMARLSATEDQRIQAEQQVVVIAAQPVVPSVRDEDLLN